MYALSNPIRPYEWGSHSVLAELTGRPAPTDTPEAEMWLGAHPQASSMMGRGADRQSLVAAIEAHATHHLGPGLAKEYGTRLPFLFKVLAAERPLSIQTHPTPAQARAGFAAEQTQGVPADDPKRTYHDPFAKPELFLAQSDCEVLCGFRPVEQSARILRALDLPSLEPHLTSLLGGPADEALRAVVTTLLSLPEARRTELVADAITAAGSAARAEAVDDDVRDALEWVVRLGQGYPTDIGVVLCVLMNHVRLQPGEALFLAPGQPHAYLRGWGLEAQANSDNTLRCGLTRKHVDVPELLRTLVFEPGTPAVVRAEPVEGSAAATFWPTPAREFELSRWEVDGKVELPEAGPQIVLCLAGELRATGSLGAVELSRGQSAYAPAAEGSIELDGRGVAVRVTAARCHRAGGSSPRQP